MNVVPFKDANALNLSGIPMKVEIRPCDEEVGAEEGDLLGEIVIMLNEDGSRSDAKS